MKEEYGFELDKEIGKNYDAVIIAVNHKQYPLIYTRRLFCIHILPPQGVIADVKGIYRGKIKKFGYWSL